MNTFDNKKLVFLIIGSLSAIFLLIIIIITQISSKRNNAINSQNNNLNKNSTNRSSSQSVFNQRNTKYKSEKNKSVVDKKNYDENPSVVVFNRLLSLGKNEISPKTNIKTIYHSGIICENNQCQNQPKDKQLTIPFIWGALQLYKITADENLLSKIESNVNYIADQTLQPDFWHCKFLKELSETERLKKVENTFKKLCQETYLLFFKPVNEYSKNVDVNTFSFSEAKDEIEGKTVITSSSTIFLPENISDFIIFSSYVTDLVVKYQWFKNPNDLRLARGYFDSAIKYYIKNKNNQNLVGLPLLTIGAFYLYDATQNENYYHLAFYLSNKAIALNRSYVKNLLYICLLDEDLYQRTGSKIYADDIKNILNHLQQNYYDSKMKLIYQSKSNNYAYYNALNNILFSYFNAKYK